MALGDKKVADRALRLANQRMRVEILPHLSTKYPRPNTWNPLRSQFQVSSPYGVKLWANDKGALEILRDDQLMAATTKIVIETVIEGALWEPKAFVTDILQHLMTEDG